MRWTGMTLIGAAMAIFLVPYAAYFLCSVFLRSPALGLITSLFIFPATIFLVIYFVLGKKNLYYSFIPEATAKVTVRGDKFEAAAMNWEGHAFDKAQKGVDKWNVIKVTEEEIKAEREKQGFLKKVRQMISDLFGGLWFYGIWPVVDIYVYKFTWVSIGEREEIKPKTERLDYILLRDDVYWTKVDRCEDSQLFPLELELLLTIRIINPYKALFNIQKWLETVTNRIKPFIRAYITGDEYANWIKNKAKLGQKLWDYCNDNPRDENDKILLDKDRNPLPSILQEFMDRYGVDIRKIEVKEINPPKEHREKTIAPYLAELTKKATIINAEAEAKRIENVFGKIESFGELGKLIRTLEAVEKSPLPASLVVQAVPGLQEAFRGVFGKQLPREIEPEDLKALLKELKDLHEEIKKAKQP